MPLSDCSFCIFARIEQFVVCHSIDRFYLINVNRSFGIHSNRSNDVWKMRSENCVCLCAFIVDLLSLFQDITLLSLAFGFGLFKHSNKLLNDLKEHEEGEEKQGNGTIIIFIYCVELPLFVNTLRLCVCVIPLWNRALNILPATRWKTASASRMKRAANNDKLEI